MEPAGEETFIIHDLALKNTLDWSFFFIFYLKMMKRDILVHSTEFARVQ